MKLFTFQFTTGDAEMPFHHRFEVMADSHEKAVEYLLTTDEFQRVEQMSNFSEQDRERIEAALKSPRVLDRTVLVDWQIFTDEETSPLGPALSQERIVES